MAHAETYEEPSYDIIKQQDNLELRAYKPTLIAEVTLPGTKDGTMNDAFRILADFIFGNNIAMTTPVAGTEKTTIAMTAPVTGLPAAQGYTTQFTMPSQYTLATLPKPKDDRIIIREQPARRMIVAQFSWWMTNGKINDATTLLNDFAQKNQLRITGQPVIAFYNPPWSLPWLRRNEVMLAVE